MLLHGRERSKVFTAHCCADDAHVLVNCIDELHGRCLQALRLPLHKLGESKGWNDVGEGGTRAFFQFSRHLRTSALKMGTLSMRTAFSNSVPRAVQNSSRRGIMCNSLMLAESPSRSSAATLDALLRKLM